MEEEPRKFTKTTGEFYLVRGELLSEYSDDEVLSALKFWPAHNDLPSGTIVPYNIADVMAQHDGSFDADDYLASPPRKRLNSMPTPKQYASVSCSDVTQQFHDFSPYKDKEINYIYDRTEHDEGVSEIDWSTITPKETLPEIFLINKRSRKSVIASKAPNLCGLAGKPSAAPATPTDTVKVEAMPSPYCEDFFKHWLTKEIRKHTFDDKTIEVVSITKQQDNSGLIKLNSVAAAAKVASLYLHYEGQNLKFLQVEETCPQAEPTRQLLLTGVSHPFFKDHFLHVLNRYLSKAGVGTEIMNSPDLADGEESLVIELNSVQDATRLLLFSSTNIFTYMERTIEFHLTYHYNAEFVASTVEPSAPPATPTDTVKVEAMPSPYFEDFFKHWLTKEIRKYTFDDKTIEVVSITKQQDNSGLIKLNSVAAAAKVASSYLHYEGQNLKFLQVEETCPQAEPTRQLLLTGVSHPFFKDHFLHVLNRYLSKAGVCTEIMNSPDLADGEESLVIELNSVQDATRLQLFSSTNPFTYGECEIAFHLTHEDVPHNTTYNESWDRNDLSQNAMAVRAEVTQSSRKVSIRGISPPFSKADFLQNLQDQVHDAGIERSNLCSCSDSLQNDDNSVIVEFNSAGNAKIFCGYNELFPLKYKNVELKAFHLPVTDEGIMHVSTVETFNMIDNFVNTSTPATSPLHWSDNEEKDPSYEPEIDDEKKNYVDVSDSENGDNGAVEIKDDELTRAYIACCMQVMSNGKYKPGNKSNQRVTELLLDLYNVKVTNAECQRKWKSLGDRYRLEKVKKNSTWEYRYDMAVLKGEPSVFGKRISKTTTGNSPKRDKIVSSPVKKWHSLKTAGTAPKPKGEKANFSHAATLYLIELRREFDEKFDSSTYRNAELWEIIANKMSTEKNYHYSGKQCEGRMDRLMDQYKLYEETSAATGNTSMHFKYLEEMRTFMGKWVNVRPKCVLAFGSVSKSIFDAERCD